jgi:hypothetical protein
MLGDLVGNRFGQWLVQEISDKRSGKRQQRRHLKCMCTCGTVSDVYVGHLKNGASTRCVECRFKLQSRKRNKRAVYTAEQMYLNRIFRRSKQSAEERGLQWALTKEEVSIIIQQECYWGGCAPEIRYYRIRGKDDVTRSRPEVSMIANGMDRKDNTEGYTWDNTVPCCKQHNSMKSDLSIDAFLSLVSSVYLRHMEGK